MIDGGGCRAGGEGRISRQLLEGPGPLAAPPPALPARLPTRLLPASTLLAPLAGLSGPSQRKCSLPPPPAKGTQRGCRALGTLGKLSHRAQRSDLGVGDVFSCPPPGPSPSAGSTGEALDAPVGVGGRAALPGQRGKGGWGLRGGGQRRGTPEPPGTLGHRGGRLGLRRGAAGASSPICPTPAAHVCSASSADETLCKETRDKALGRWLRGAPPPASSSEAPGPGPTPSARASPLLEAWQLPEVPPLSRGGGRRGWAPGLPPLPAPAPATCPPTQCIL